MAKQKTVFAMGNVTELELMSINSNVKLAEDVYGVVVAIRGVSKSISKLARDIYNNITNNDYVQHQAVFDQNRKIIIRPDTFTR